jgi:predicted amidohydrolase YtcJ
MTRSRALGRPAIQPPAADPIVRAGRFATPDKRNPLAQAVAMRRGRFAGVGGVPPVAWTDWRAA